MGQGHSSREILLTAISCGRSERIPCCFISFRVMRNRCRDWYEVAEREASMGLDPMLFVPPAERHERPEHPDLRGLPIRFHPDVITREWKENSANMPYPVLYKEYNISKDPEMHGIGGSSSGAICAFSGSRPTANCHGPPPVLGS